MRKKAASLAIPRETTKTKDVTGTTRASPRASMSRKIDHLRPEGERDHEASHPTGTGFEWYRHVRIPADSLRAEAAKQRRREPPPPPQPVQPTEDDLDLDREIEYAFDTDGLPRRSA